MKYQKWNIGVPREGAVAALREAGYPYLMAVVLAVRGIASPETAAEFLDRDRKRTLSPMLRRDMDKAVAWAKEKGGTRQGLAFAFASHIAARFFCADQPTSSLIISSICFGVTTKGLLGKCF